MDRARFFLAFEDVLHIDREPAAGREDRRGGHHVRMDLAFIVGGAAREHPVADDDRLERRGGPQVQGVDRLHVVVTVDEDGRCVGGVEPVGVDDRVATGLDGLGMLEAGGGQRLDQPMSGRAAVTGMLREGRDARDPQERRVRLESGVVGVGEMGFESGVSGRHGTDCREVVRIERAGHLRPARCMVRWFGPWIRPAAGSAPQSAGRVRRRSGSRGCSPWAAGR